MFNRLLMWLLVASLGACKPKSPEVIVFHASSLSRVFGDLGERLKAGEPSWTVRLEPSGSQVAARKVSEQGLKADLVAVADDAVLERLLVPQHASGTVAFATNELVLAHLAHSPGTAEVSADNWPELVTAEGVRLACANPDLAPVGYHTQMAWQLAEAHLPRPGLAGRLASACRARAPVNDETELVALLEAKAIDYAFVYASTAEDHRLKVTRLPDAANLSSPALSSTYAQVGAEVRLRSGAEPVRLPGRPITYGLSVISSAPTPAGAKAFVELLLSDEGQRALARHGFHPIAGRPR